FALLSHDTDAQNTASMLHFVVTRYLLELLWDQKVPGSNPGAPTSKMSPAPTAVAGLSLWCSRCYQSGHERRRSHSTLLRRRDEAATDRPVLFGARARPARARCSTAGCP